MDKLIAIRNFSGAKGMILKGDIIEVSEPYYTDYQTTGLCVKYVIADQNTFKTMKTKKK